ncbi:hypothetical protein Alches_18440 [Alicyclobacillus hesperidum subsp. aegles]|nr:hypothetical protein Alches_18440 [Alicyclobacillus hesperidum subsp. aegles]
MELRGEMRVTRARSIEEKSTLIPFGGRGDIYRLLYNYNEKRLSY